MKKTKIMALLLSATLVFSGCGNMNNTAKGGLIGGGGGAALGAIIGGIAGHGKGAAIGAAVGAAVGTGAGVLIGKKMDKAAEEAAQIQGAQVEQVTDNNGLQAVKVTFDSGILFNTGTRTEIWMYPFMDIQTTRAGETVQLNKVSKKTSICHKNALKVWLVICWVAV